MQYMLMIYLNEAEAAKASEGERTQMSAPYIAYTEALAKSGALVAGDRLQPSSAATIVRVADGKTQALDGPYAEAKEQLGGYYIIEAPDLDAAIAWAARCPGAARGAIEVRPIIPMKR